jgi:hypothetical protein
MVSVRVMDWMMQIVVDGLHCSMPPNDQAVIVISGAETATKERCEDDGD